MHEAKTASKKRYGDFAAPEDILAEHGLAPQAKEKLLRDWKRDLEQLSTATNENMPDMGRRMARGGRTPPEELLRRVGACLSHLAETVQPRAG